MSKCQKRTDKKGQLKKCIRYDGKWVYYTTSKNLALQLHIDPMIAEDIIESYENNEEVRRVIRNKKGELDVADILETKMHILLRNNFGVNKVSNKKIISGFSRPNRTIVAKEFGPNYPISSGQIVIITMWIDFVSGSFFDLKYVLNKYGKKHIDNINDQYTKKVIDRNTRNSFILNNLVQKKLDECEQFDISLLTREEIAERSDNINNGIPVPNKIYNRSVNTITTEGALGRLTGVAINEVDLYMTNLPAILEFYKIQIVGNYTGHLLDFQDGYVREVNNIYKLDAWANLEYKEYQEDDSCMVKFLASKYPDKYWKIKKMETKHGIRTVDFEEICKKNNLPYILRHSDGSLICESNIKYNKINEVLTGIIYNNHVYAYSGGKSPIKTNENNINIITIESGRKQLKYFLNNKIIPRNIKINVQNGEVDIISLSFKKDRYINNPDYEKCKKYLTNMGFPEMMKDTTRITDIPTILEKKFNIDMKYSFFPEKASYRTNPYQYRKEHLEDYATRNIKSFDKNKAYISALMSLEYLLYFDYRTNLITNNIMDIESKNLYWCTPKYSSLQQPESGFYEGKDILEYEKIGMEFDIKEEMVMTIGPNYWRQILQLMSEHMDNRDFKEVGNMVIGCFERRFANKLKYKLNNIANKESAKMFSGFKSEIGDHVLCFDVKREIVGVRDNFPIAIQIKNKSRMEIARFIHDNNISSDKILAVCTDSITCYGKIHINEKLNKDNINGWKKIDLNIDNIKNYPIPVDVRNNLSCINIENPNKQTRVLYDQYAGGGKTTYIVNTLIPQLIKCGITYIVLTPSHKTLQEYKKLGLVCEIIQYYIFVDKNIPQYEYVIIDEIGFMDLKCHDILYKICKSGIPYAAFGDFKQLLPYDKKTCNKPHYLNFMFNKINTEWVNYRNNFTKKYYDNLLYAKIDLIDEVKKYSTEKYRDAELIICFRHETRKLYNDKMLKYLKLEPYGVGTKIVSMTNKLFKDFNIYNRKELTVHKIRDDYRILIDEEGIYYNIPNTKFNIKIKKPYFDHNYCVNIHQVQGMTLKSYYWCTEDDFALLPNTNNEYPGRIAYTIISRLFQQNSRNTKPIVNNNSNYEEIYKKEVDN